MWVLGSSLRCINFQIQSYSLVSSALSLQGQNHRGFTPCPYMLSLCYAHYRQLTLSGQKVQYNRLSTVKCHQIFKNSFSCFFHVMFPQSLQTKSDADRRVFCPTVERARWHVTGGLSNKDRIITVTPGFDPRERQRIFPVVCVRTSSEANPASCPMGTGGSFPGVKRGRSVTLTTHPHLLPRSRMIRSHIVSPCCRLRGVAGQLYFIFIY
jgi:hypothetical protein